jgi:hypothetical protein
MAALLLKIYLWWNCENFAFNCIRVTGGVLIIIPVGCGYGGDFSLEKKCSIHFLVNK